MHNDRLKLGGVLGRFILNSYRDLKIYNISYQKKERGYMGNSKKWKALVLSLCMVMSVLLGGTTEVYAANNVYEYMGIELDESPMTIYTNQIELRRIDVYNDSFQSDSTAREKVFKSIVCTSSDKSVVSFVTEK